MNTEQGREDFDRSRLKVVRIPVTKILEFLWCQKRAPEYVDIPDLRLPKGFRIIGTPNLTWPLQCIEVLIQHDSFDKVPDGEIPPRWEYPTDGNPIMHRLYSLVTKEEAEARAIKNMKQCEETLCNGENWVSPTLDIAEPIYGPSPLYQIVGLIEREIEITQDELLAAINQHNQLPQKYIIARELGKHQPTFDVSELPLPAVASDFRLAIDKNSEQATKLREMEDKLRAKMDNKPDEPTIVE